MPVPVLAGSRQGKAAHKRRRHVLSSLAAVAWEHLACALANRDQHKEPSLFFSLCKNSDTWATGGAPHKSDSDTKQERKSFENQLSRRETRGIYNGVKWQP